MFLTTNTKPELESLSARDRNLSCIVREMEPGRQQESEMGGNDDQSGKASANKAPLSCVSQGEEQGEHGSGKGNEQLTNRAALRKGKWTVSQAVIVPACDW
jgi:hypothetical protein